MVVSDIKLKVYLMKRFILKVGGKLHIFGNTTFRPGQIAIYDPKTYILNLRIYVTFVKGCRKWQNAILK